MKTFKRVLTAILIMMAVGIAACAWIYYGSRTSNPYSYETVGDIPTPIGYARMPDATGFADYARSLALKPKGSKVKLFTGGDARLQNLCYAVVDMPILSNDEQCADVCYRLRAEHLRKSGKSITFTDVNNRKMTCPANCDRKTFDAFLRKVYGVASTFSLSRYDTKSRKVSDLRPGDVFVFAAADRFKQKMGHAIMVVDVAINPTTGKKVFLLAEGNTPARDIHVMRNWQNPFRSPWFAIDDDDETFCLSPFIYKKNELRHF